jgi:hypothetical protein
LDVGDLVFNTSNNELRVYNGSAWQGGVTATGNLVSKSGDTMTGTLIIDGGRLILGQTDTTGVDGEADDLIVASTGHTGITVRSGSSSNASVYFADQDAVRQGRIEYNHTSDYMRFNTSGTERFRFGASGELGIGGATYGTSGQVLTSQGSGSAPQWADVAGGTEVVATGNLKSTIDTELSSLTTGDYNLALGSTALTSLTSGDNNIALGNGALDSLTTSSNNIGIGQNALHTITVGGIRNIGIGRDTGAITEGDDNVFIGDQTGGQLTANSSRNVLIGAQIKNGNAGNIDNLTIVGHQAGYNISSGHSNSIVGANAGYNLTSGTQNVLFGRNAGYDLTTGTNNVIIGSNAGDNTTTTGGTTAVGYNATGGQGVYGLMLGYNAGSTNITGAYNIGLGYNVHGNLTSGTYNTAIGYNATATSGQYNILIGREVQVGSGGNNVLLGNNAGSTNITGSNNIGLGTDAIADLTSGSYNICLGYYAGRSINTGVGNVILGYMQGGAQPTTGSYNTVLGYQAGNGVTTGSNNIVLGNGADPSAAGVSNEITLGNTSITKFRVPGVDFVVEGSAWVNFNGTGTVAIRASNNVSSITDHSTGRYTVNFTNAMPDANYAAFGNCGGSSSANGDESKITFNSSSYTTTSLYVRIVDSVVDPIIANINVVR